MNKELLQQMISERLVSVQKHPEADLFIHNYSPRVQYERLWNEVTLSCRGLILDVDGNFVARPFGKFFNLEEHTPEQIPQLAFDVFDKLDGSLGILYWLNDKPYLATRGSFTSEQAIHGTDILHSKYSHTFDRLDRNKTYLFEIIYPSNRIVVDYGQTDDIFLLTAIDNETGLDESLPDIGFPTVKQYDGINELQQLKALEENNKEGFVVRFNNGFRVKMKFAEYVRLHRIVTGVSNIAIWEYLADGKPFDELLERVPDEFFAWVKHTQHTLTGQYAEIEKLCKSVFKDFGGRKETALYFQQQKYPSVLFSMLDGKPYEKVIWKIIRPKFSKPFKTEA